MRRVAYALTASIALMFGALTPVSAGCYGDCTGYQEGGYREGNRGPSSYENYSDRPYYRGRSSYYNEGPRYHTTYYERGPEYSTGYYERPVYRARYDDDGYYERPYYRRHHHHYSSCGYDYSSGCGGYRGYRYGSYYPTVRYGGAWTQTAAAYGYGYNGYGYNGYGWGGCHTAYVPYGWTWYRAHSC